VTAPLPIDPAELARLLTPGFLSFVGAHEVKGPIEEIEAHRFLFLTGKGGVGKTTVSPRWRWPSPPAASASDRDVPHERTAQRHLGHEAYR
jgi:hypothetical protein